jgi:hypothetical protein
MVENSKIETMEEKIDRELKAKAIHEMKEPTILMNDLDFDNWVMDLEDKLDNFKIDKNLVYKGFPIKAIPFLGRGCIIVYDNYTNNF